MNLPFPPPYDQVIYRLGWTLIHTLWIGAAVAMVFALTMAALPRRWSQYRYLAGCVAMLALLASAIVVFVVIPPQVRQTPTAAGSDNARSLADTQITSPLTAGPMQASDARAMLSVASQARPAEAGTAQAPAAPAAEQRLSAIDRAAAALAPALPWLVLAWIVGVCILSVWQLGGWIAAQRLRRLAVRPADAALTALAGRIARAMGLTRAVRLFHSGLVRVPAVIGWLRPVILLPLGFATGLTPAQVESILVHELAHIRRHDYLVNLLQSLVETLLFYHPATWYISRHIRIERENCCDDLALAHGANEYSYAQSLLHLARQSAAGSHQAISPVGMAATGKASQLRARISRLLGIQDRSCRPWSNWPIVLCTLVLGIIGGSAMVASCADSQPSSPSLAANSAASTTQPATSKSPATAPATQPATPPMIISSDKGLEMLQTLQKQNLASIQSIHTWKGKATLVRRIDEKGIHKNSEYARSSKIEYAADLDHGVVRWNQELTLDKWVVNGKPVPPESELFVGTVNGMIDNNRWFRYWIRPEERGNPKHDLSIIALNLHGAQGAALANILGQGVDENFDPRTYMGDYEAQERLKFFSDQAKDPRLGPWYISRNGDLITLKCNFGPGKSFVNEYIFDTSKGSRLTRFYAKDNQSEHTDVCDYQLVDGVWVPASVIMTLTNDRNGAKTLMVIKVTWHTDLLNRKLDPGEFSLEKLGVKPGDTVQDDVAHTPPTEYVP